MRDRDLGEGSVTGSKRTMALALKSLSHTASVSSTYTAYVAASPGRSQVVQVSVAG
jgi:hypothetical protein